MVPPDSKLRWFHVRINPRMKGTMMQETAHKPLSLSELGIDKLPAGDYAMYNRATEKLHFFSVTYGNPRGRWAGYTFVEEHHGPNREKIRDAQVRIQILNAIGRDPVGCLKKYATEKGVCGLCGLELTDPKSREIGIGPVCRKKHFGLT